jgi:DNA-binding LacI/PurR family transcriptional regulator
MVRMKDVAKHAGVSVATVSYVLSGKPGVGEAVRERVLESIRELNYEINLVARGFKAQKTNTIGIILPDVTKLFFLNVLKGIMETAAKHQYSITISSSDFDFSVERRLIATLRGSRVEGIVLGSCVDRTFASEWAAELASGKGDTPPVVSLECLLDTRYVSSVVVDTRNLSSRLTQHLVDTGRRRIFFIAGPVHIEYEYDHLEGYKNVLKKNDIPVLDELIAGGDFMSKTAYTIVCDALKKGIRFDAIQASNDQAAIGAIKALDEHGFSVPGDVAVCGYDNLFPSTLVTPSITTVSVPGYKMGITAVEEVLRRIKDRNAFPKQYCMDAEIVIRSSSQPDIKTPWNLDNW